MQHFEKRIPIFLELGLRAEAVPALKDYIDLLWDANTQLNLISRKMTFEELIDNHLIDCLLPLKYFPKDVKVAADFGSGGGLPGVVYAIQFPEVRFRLYEKSRLKQEFLNHCKKQVAPNLEVLGEIPPQLGQIEIVMSRAFKPIDVLLEMSRSFYQKGGKYFLLKARREKIDEELAAAQKQFKNLKAQITPLTSPVLEVERHLVQI
ncbi:MAG: 16S rRNA (guanine(527)-N(7))-methyltransferase RsmG [Bdellovibrionales bacterium]